MTIYNINKGFILQKLSNKTVIFDGEESMLYTFNETASFIFQKLKLKWPEEKIIDGLQKKYQISKQKATNDLKKLIVDLKKKKIISSL